MPLSEQADHGNCQNAVHFSLYSVMYLLLYVWVLNGVLFCVRGSDGHLDVAQNSSCLLAITYDECIVKMQQECPSQVPGMADRQQLHSTVGDTGPHFLPEARRT